MVEGPAETEREKASREFREACEQIAAEFRKAAEETTAAINRFVKAWRRR